MLTKYFGTEYPKEMWLGGSVRRTTSRLFVLSWIDGLKFAYHRFPNTERKRWQSNWRLNSQGCIVANMQSEGLGSWTAELTPCSEPRGFVCKESVQPPRQQQESDQTHNLLMPHLLDFSTLIRSVLARPFFLSPVVPPEVPQDRRRAVHMEAHKSEGPVDHAIRLPLSTTTVEPVTFAAQPNSITATMNTTTAGRLEDQAAQESEVTTPPISTTENSMASETNVAEKPSSTSTTAATLASQPVRREPRKPTFKVFPATENAKKRVRRSSTTTSQSPSLPKVAAQMIYPQTVWDLTHPEEPKLLPEKVE
ncbi:unnamed protein product [Dicrocoelium dendriticum]|nr:unnamed protein product [Dicrocoelium dendriticum]